MAPRVLQRNCTTFSARRLLTAVIPLFEQIYKMLLYVQPKNHAAKLLQLLYQQREFWVRLQLLQVLHGRAGAPLP
jgi:hypothetical protein